MIKTAEIKRTFCQQVFFAFYTFLAKIIPGLVNKKIKAPSIYFMGSVNVQPFDIGIKRWFCAILKLKFNLNIQEKNYDNK